MDIVAFKKQVRETVIAELISYMQEDEDRGYGKRHITACEKLLRKYLDKLGHMKSVSDEAVMQEVKKVVLSLNRLNEKTEYSLIETDARESIWEIIQNSAVARGLKDVPDDVTEEWREW